MDFTDRIDECCFVFRGYNTTNLGRSGQLLDHEQYGPILEQHLREASDIASGRLGISLDLIGQVRRGEETTLQSFPQAVALIMATEMAQMSILSKFFNVDISLAKLATGYSLGEITAIVCGGVIPFADALSVLLDFANDCAELGENTRMGIVFSRAGELPAEDIQRLCVQISAEDRGVIAVSAYLSPNTLLLLGQNDTVDRFNSLRKQRLPKEVHLRKNDHRWPPLHTPIVWQRNVSNRAGVQLQSVDGGFVAPKPPIISLVTGEVSYNAYNARELLTAWVDHPQQVWKAVCETLSAGVKTVVHVGPQPNLFPSTYKRIAENVSTQMSGTSAASLGKRIVSGMIDRPWLANLLPSQASLLRAPALEHVILEDWLLEAPDAS